MAQYTEYHPLKFWLDPASIAEIVAHIQTYLVNNPINSTTEIETIINDYLIAHPEIIGGVRSINGETGEVVLTADNISGGENVTIKDVLDSLQDQIDDIVASIPSDYQQLINDVSDLKSAAPDYLFAGILQSGTINSDGSEGVQSKRKRTDFIPIDYRLGYIAEVDADIGMNIYYYSSEKEYVAQGGQWQYGERIILPRSAGIDKIKNVAYFRILFRDSGNTDITNRSINLSIRLLDMELAYRFPVLLNQKAKCCFYRQFGQDIAVYNGHYFDFGTGTVSVDGADAVSISNGHGNNCNFGQEIHGEYPYLYCGSWSKDTCTIYVNQYSGGAFNLIKTIKYNDLSGFLNACVDEVNDRAYLLVEKGSDTYAGLIDFVVADLDGNVINTKRLPETIPVIEGMTFYDGRVYVCSGHGADWPNYIWVFDTDGNLLSKTAKINMEWADTTEGFDIDQVTGKAYIGLTGSSSIFVL